MKTSFLKTTVVAALFATTAFTTNAQVYEQGSKILNVGLGIGSTFVGTGLESTLPPIGASFEYGVTDKISAGAYLGYAAAKQDVPFWGEYKYTYLIMGARGSYHFELLDTDKFDTYAGLMLGYNKASVKIDKAGAPAGATAGGFLVGGHLGLRYMFTDNLGAFAELGYGIAYLQLGVTAKF